MLVLGRRVGPDEEGITDWARAGAAGVGGGTVGARDETPEVEAIAGEKGGIWSFENLTETCQLE